MERALLNGQSLDHALSSSRGLHYGDGVFRTIAIKQGRLLDWSRHLQKLTNDCRALFLDVPNTELLSSEAVSLAEHQNTAVLKIILTRKTRQRGYVPHGRECDRLLLRYVAPEYPAHYKTIGIHAFRSPIQLASQPALAGIKHLNRLEQVLASRDWPSDMQEGIMCDQAGQPICGTRSNLFWIRAGELFTPDLSYCGVAGVMRDKLIELSRILGIPVSIRPQDWKDLQQAEEVFLTNSLIGIWPVTKLDATKYAVPGPMTQKLMAALDSF